MNQRDIWLLTPIHSGTHLMKLILEAHPDVDYQGSTHWAENQLRELGYSMPHKSCPRWKIRHRHLGFNYVSPKGLEDIVITIRDPLKSLVTSARRRSNRDDKWVYLENIAKGYGQACNLVRLGAATFVSVDLQDRIGAERAIERVGLNITTLQMQLIDEWPKIKSTNPKEHPMIHTVPPAIQNPFKRLLHQYELQEFFYEAGYTDLDWFSPF